MTATLRVERPGIVIYCSGRLGVHFFVERLAAKERNVTLCVHRPVERDSFEDVKMPYLKWRTNKEFESVRSTS